ncbi:type II toxin-antitoxin system PemK/MazF family toxin [Nocardiopsis sp. HUAS JQ3]|uniref:type II toxin-antitoxin system PemK/MazF family toxin n=1 Tax=Nocardiopsis sp. HUAS JQ3 TaxID=3061629 RepID=UPI0023A9789A|nr:type II toxin-antitoxin system PemK/MazF family toxin [Nocardiopsis sp. HUAS JQ3]WDZ89507.1 type II toxin-antitoxin system PemK/MazF family toxin [Nocardiopsis sp. HUAS JQ3]
MSEPTTRRSEDHPHRGEVREIPTAASATRLVYAPERDGLADAGEIVWTWVPYEEDPGRGKDRPLLVVGRRGGRLHGLMLSSQRPEAWERQDWLPVGSGPWDREQRDSYVRVDRLFEFDEDDIRREAAVMDEELFWMVADVLRARYGWN